MAKIKAILDLKHPKKDGTCSVYIVTSVKSQMVWFKTGVSVAPTNWIRSLQCIEGKSKEVKDDNILINDCKARLSDIIVKYRLRHEEFTVDLLRKEYANPSIGIDFYAFWEVEMKSKKDFVSASTHRQHEAVLSKLKVFRPKCTFSELDREFIVEYQRHCLKKLKNAQSTINKNLKTIKEYVSIAIQQEKLLNNPFETIKIKNLHPDIVFLNQDELDNAVAKYKEYVLPQNFQAVLRRFLFSCFTGIRLSDSLALTWDNIVSNTLVVKPQKTQSISKIVRIPLNKAARELLKDCDKSATLVFEKSAEQTINKHLKPIMGRCKINKALSFHASRHTFATSYYRITRDIVGLQKLLGHSDLKQTMVYTHIVSTDIETEIKKLDKLWTPQVKANSDVPQDTPESEISNS